MAEEKDRIQDQERVEEPVPEETPGTGEAPSPPGPPSSPGTGEEERLLEGAGGNSVAGEEGKAEGEDPSSPAGGEEGASTETGGEESPAEEEGAPLEAGEEREPAGGESLFEGNPGKEDLEKAVEAALFAGEEDSRQEPSDPEEGISGGDTEGVKEENREEEKASRKEGDPGDGEDRAPEPVPSGGEEEASGPPEETSLPAAEGEVAPEGEKEEAASPPLEEELSSSPEAPADSRVSGDGTGGEGPAEEEEDYEFDLEGISLDDPSEEEEEDSGGAEEAKADGEGGSAAAGPGKAPPSEEVWPEDEEEGKPLLVSLKERLQAVPRRKLGIAAVLVVAPLLAVLFLGLPVRRIERVPPKPRIPDAVAPGRSGRAREIPGGVPRDVPGYLPPVVLRRNPPPPAKDRPPLWAAAEQKARAGDYAGAIILLEKYLAGNPPLSPEEKSDAWYDLSRWYRKVGDKETSRKYFSMALDTTWTSLGPKELFLGGLELHKAGKYRQARRYFAAFLLQEDLMVPELKKKISQAWYLLAEGYRLEAEAGEKAQERREDALRKAAAAGKKGGKGR